MPIVVAYKTQAVSLQLPEAFTLHAPRVRKFDDLWLCWSAWLDTVAPATKTTYLGVIIDWCKFLQLTPGTADAANKLKRATGVESLAYFADLKRRRGQAPRALAGKDVYATLAAATVRKHLMALRKAYGVLQAHKLFTGVNPFDPLIVKPPKQNLGRKRETEMVPFKSVTKVLSYGNDGPKGIRDRALLGVLFGGGLRRGEAAKLLCGDVGTTAKGTVFLTLRGTKSGEDKHHALPGAYGERVLELLRQRRSEGARNSSPLFNAYVGRGGLHSIEAPMSVSGIYKLFKAACKKAGLGPEFSPHSARATAITKLLSDGLQHREVQEFSRHKSIQMVELYDKRRYEIDSSPAKALSFDD